jgi:hypothetical protein
MPELPVVCAGTASGEKEIEENGNTIYFATALHDPLCHRRLHATGDIGFELKGPGDLVGDNPFLLADSGGGGAIWIKSRAAQSGRIDVKATHSMLGVQTISISTRAS